MPRRRFEDDPRDDYDDDPRPARQRSSNTGLIVGLLVAVGLLVVLVCGGGVAWFLFRSAPPPPNAPVVQADTRPAEPIKAEEVMVGPGARRVYTRADFKALVLSKTTADVLRKLGEPNERAFVAGDQVWYYEGVTRDDEGDRLDGRTGLIVERDAVVGIRFEADWTRKADTGK